MDPLSRLFAGLARLRNAPAFHPVGRCYTGLLWIDDTDRAGVVPPGSHPVLVRLSRGLGLPSRLPDFLGVAIRLEPTPGGVVDLLCTSAVQRRGLRRLVRPATGWAGTELDSVMAYGRGRITRWVRLRMSADQGSGLPIRLSIEILDARGAAHAVGAVRLTAVADPPGDGFDPIRHPPPGWRLRPGWLATARARAYVGSRRGRGAPEALRTDPVLPAP